MDNTTHPLLVPGLYEKAIELIERASERSGKNINIRFNVGRKYWVVGVGNKSQGQSKTLLDAIESCLEYLSSREAREGEKKEGL